MNWVNMKYLKQHCLIWAVSLVVLSTAAMSQAASLKTQNVFLIISDGLRWQEVFTGADDKLLTKENGGVANVASARAEYWRDTAEARRKVLMPFLWNTIAVQGQVMGNRTKGSAVSVTNGLKFSYPGYNELITGFGDPRINSNDRIPNPNSNVFEWLSTQSGFRGRVAVFGTWDLFPYIFNCERSQLPVWPSWEQKFQAWEIRVPASLSQLYQDTTPSWEGVAYDSFICPAVSHHMRQARPRVVFVGLGETDEWPHGGRYDLYLHTARQADRYVQRLWETAQSLPQYRNKTTFIFTTDHGRGSGLKEWQSHGQSVNGAEDCWIAVIGPDTPPLGERTQTEAHTQSQIAATIAALLGKDYCAINSKAGAPITDVLTGSSQGAFRK